MQDTLGSRIDRQQSGSNPGKNGKRSQMLTLPGRPAAAGCTQPSRLSSLARENSPWLKESDASAANPGTLMFCPLSFLLAVSKRTCEVLNSAYRIPQTASGPDIRHTVRLCQESRNPAHSCSTHTADKLARYYSTVYTAAAKSRLQVDLYRSVIELSGHMDCKS